MCVCVCVCVCVKIKFFKPLIHEYHQSNKQFGSDFGPKLLANVMEPAGNENPAPVDNELHFCKVLAIRLKAYSTFQLF